MKTTVDLSNTSFIQLVGPTSVGKGYTTNLVMAATAGMREEHGLSIGIIEMGNRFREMLKTDPAFAAMYREPMKNGDLVDDEKTIEVFEDLLSGVTRDGAPDIIIIDGFSRTPRQVDYSVANGFAQKKDMVFVFSAPINACLDRFIHRKGLTNDRLETEVPTFNKRYHLHEKLMPSIRKGFMSSDARIIDIDAKDAIASHVFPSTLNRLLPFMVETIVKKRSKEGSPVSV